ncbi:MAG: putative uncharacterized nin region protein [Prokaryotic dsDNA virus sp.]|nr:MAG: putative uncharacterized nin region protein [Prokaryotic dsDNA virus sp.]|tara:strand:+ start:5942 stop:6907 length:966 start_codon:yes stop_codon:yes gene_type:complete
MKKVVSFSGGRTSAYLCKLMIEKFGRENVDFIYMDTGAEHLKTYRFIRKVNDEFGLDLICLRGDFSLPLGAGVGYKVVGISSLKPDLIPFKGMIEKYGVPYIGGMFCTDRMKLRPFKKYCDDVYGKNNHETWLGIREDEPKRLTPKPFIKYMAEISDFDKQDVLSWWSKAPFDLDLDEWSGNCEFCPKKSNLKLAASQRDSPGSYINWLESISDASVRLVPTRTIAYMKSKGIKHYKSPLNPSVKVSLKIKEYNDNLFTSKNKNWELYGKAASSIMYRGKQSLESLIAKFDGSTGTEIKARIKGSKMIDTNSCSESCEVFN